MTLDRDAGESKAGEGDIAVHQDWFAVGWPHVLPRHQAFLMCMVLSTAATRPVTGTLDEVVRELFGDSLAAFLRGLGEDLDSPVLWLQPDDLAYAEGAEEEARLRAETAAHRAACEDALRAGGFPVPATIRDLVDTMVALGIARTTDGRWSMPERLPLPEDVLALPERLRETFRALRRSDAVAPWKHALARYLDDGLGRPGELFTTPGRLAETTGLDPDDLRTALDDLVEEGDARLYRGVPRVPVASARDLQDHQRFHLVLDWDHYDENHFVVARTDGLS
ncbi:DUF6042 family protein [Streptomyces sp. NBC_00094]|uniref:DUF6042 family protein n=1 Tax=Streptomyces sp. NBC_00094 TaxID=2903620 RepID=UPI00225AB6A0|nr:DUF6042 family protein [Streptomyces sp. NBC_00094]MCX5393944.1 DUF6042 family protein [Streptomyces sp. NBC_00094]